LLLAADASDVGWSGHTIGVLSYIAHEYFSEWESRQSSTYGELSGVNRCLQALIDLCRSKILVLQVDAVNILGVINRGSPKLPFNILARELFWFCLAKQIVISVDWVPRESNAFADESSKWLIPNDWSIYQAFFLILYANGGLHTCDYFASNENNLCFIFSHYIGAAEHRVSMLLCLIGVSSIVG
jgi:hypothetical protein